MKSICVFCGSSDSLDQDYKVTLANNGIQLVYSGGKTGLMSEVANEALCAGGLALINTPAVAEGFIFAEHRQAISLETDPNKLQSPR